MPELSIITVCLNDRIGLEKTIKSVLAQTYKDYEYIVIDGASTDGSTEILDTYRNQLAHAISEKDDGIYNAMNKGIKKATGKYCLFLNSGDVLFEKDTLSKVFFTQRGEDILYGDLIFDYLNGVQRLVNMPGSIGLKHMIRDTLFHPASFIKTELFNRIGNYNEQFVIASDYAFFFKAIIVEKVSLYYLNETIAIYRFDGISSQKSNEALILNERRKIQLQYLSLSIIESALKKSYAERIYRKYKSWLRLKIM